MFLLIFSDNWASEKISAFWQNVFDWFSKLRPTCPTEQLEEEYLVSKKFLYLNFFGLWKNNRSFVKNFLGGNVSFAFYLIIGTLPGKCLSLMGKIFLSPCFWYLEKRFWQSGIKNSEVFITACCVFIKNFDEINFNGKNHIVFMFLGHWAIFFGFLALSFHQVCRNCILNVYWNTSSSFFIFIVCSTTSKTDIKRFRLPSILLSGML